MFKELFGFDGPFGEGCKSERRIAISVCIFTLIVMSAMGLVINHGQEVDAAPAVVQVVRPVLDPTNKQFDAALDVAGVFGRSQGCTKASPKLITDIAEESIKDNLDPKILAATVAVESACDPMAVSRRGALGLTQVMPKIWSSKFDFEHSVNLLNPQDNLHAGATILSELIKQYGVSEGIRRYQGLGEDCPTCDNAYVPKILTLAGGR